jgi:hypothetical protein
MNHSIFARGLFLFNISLSNTILTISNPSKEYPDDMICLQTQLHNFKLGNKLSVYPQI